MMVPVFMVPRNYNFKPGYSCNRYCSYRSWWSHNYNFKQWHSAAQRCDSAIKCYKSDCNMDYHKWHRAGLHQRFRTGDSQRQWDRYSKSNCI